MLYFGDSSIFGVETTMLLLSLQLSKIKQIEVNKINNLFLMSIL